jgi:hypothetical protein
MKKTIIITGLLLFLALAGGCAENKSPDSKLMISTPHEQEYKGIITVHFNDNREIYCLVFTNLQSKDISEQDTFRLLSGVNMEITFKMKESGEDFKITYDREKKVLKVKNKEYNAGKRAVFRDCSEFTGNLVKTGPL